MMSANPSYKKLIIAGLLLLLPQTTLGFFLEEEASRSPVPCFPVAEATPQGPGPRPTVRRRDSWFWTHHCPAASPVPWVTGFGLASSCGATVTLISCIFLNSKANQGLEEALCAALGFPGLLAGPRLPCPWGGSLRALLCSALLCSALRGDPDSGLRTAAAAHAWVAPDAEPALTQEQQYSP